MAHSAGGICSFGDKALKRWTMSGRLVNRLPIASFVVSRPKLILSDQRARSDGTPIAVRT